MRILKETFSKKSMIPEGVNASQRQICEAACQPFSRGDTPLKLESQNGRTSFENQSENYSR